VNRKQMDGSLKVEGAVRRVSELDGKRKWKVQINLGFLKWEPGVGGRQPGGPDTARMFQR